MTSYTVLIYAFSLVGTGQERLVNRQGENARGAHERWTNHTCVVPSTGKQDLLSFKALFHAAGYNPLTLLNATAQIAMSALPQAASEYRSIPGVCNAQ